MSRYINSDKLLYYQERFERAKQPITAEMIMTNYCNYDCDYCRYKHGSGYFEVTDFMAASMKLRELGVKGFILTGGGEPLLNPDFINITSCLDLNGIPYGLNTNLTRLVNCRPVWLKVSIHENEDSENVIANIETFRSWNRLTTLGIQHVVETPGGLLKFYRKYKELDVDYIVFRPIEAPHKVYTPEEAQLIIASLEMLREADRRVVINYKWYMLRERFDVCRANWTVVTVDYRGDVWYCCHKPFEVVGNLFNEDDVMALKKSWRSDMSKCDVPCRMTANNLIMESYEPVAHAGFM